MDKSRVWVGVAVLSLTYRYHEEQKPIFYCATGYISGRTCAGGFVASAFQA